MVKRLYPKKIFWRAIVFLIIANLFLANFVSARQLEIKAADVEKIKTSLEITQTTLRAIDLFAKNNDLMTILNTVVGGGKTGTDITYGLLVLSAFNEMELIDLVISQQYKIDARNYFNQVLDERTNLKSYWKGISYDLPKVISGYITGSMAALTLNSFEITDKTIAIFIGFNILEKMKMYDGLWYYFDTRKQGSEPHQIAWEETKIIMGLENTSLGGLYRNNEREKKIANLEQQFLTLYDNWEPYVTPFGISEKYKNQVKKELNETLIAASKENAALAKNEPKPSLIDKLTQQLEKLRKEAAAILSQINPFKAGASLNLPELPKEPAETGTKETEPLSIETISEPEPTTESEEVELIEAKPPSTEPLLIATTTPELIASTTKPMPTPEPTPAPTPTPEPPPAPTTPGPVLCERDSGNPPRFRVLINEVAWMGTTNSPNDEWIELKNIWGIPVKLSGWQLLDKDKQIKIIFGEDDIIPAGSYYLLERTDDNSMPDAKADLIYTGALSNTDEALYLFDDQCNIEDEVLANPNWPAGDNSSEKPMARFDVLDWYADVSTPGSENNSPPAIHAVASAAAPSPAPSSVSPQIFITETYIGSEDNQKDDFVELYNSSSELIDLTNYYIQRKTENAQDFSTYVSHELLVGKTIDGQNYFLIANASSTFATSADVITDNPLTENNTLVLKNPKQEIVDQVSTDNPAVGKSYGRKWSSTTLNYTEDFEAQIPTPRTQNQNSEPVEENEEEDNSLSVIINEIAWAGTEANHFDEWLELLVNSTTSFDGWKILGSKNGTTTLEIPISGFASSSTYILIERTDDNTISDLSADFLFTGNLDNDGMKLELWNSNDILIDSVDCSSGWFAGDNITKQTMERIANTTGTDPQNWTDNNLITKNGSDATGNSINGTPKTENSVAKSYTFLSGGITFSEDFALKRFGGPYISDGPIHILSGVTLSIEPGVIIKFKHGSSRTPYAELKVEGSLEALGGSEPTQKIVFTSYKDDEYGGDTNADGAATQPAAGDWDWIYLKDSASNLQNVIVRYGGKLHSSCCGEFASYTYGAIYVDGGQLTISSSTIEKSATLGLWVKNSTNSLIVSSEFNDINTSWSNPAAVYIENGSSTISNSTFRDNNIGILVENFTNPAIENNIFEGNQTPIQIDTLLTTISGNTLNDNNYNGIYLAGLAFPEGQTSMVWKEAGIPYIINTLDLSPGFTLQVEPGVVIKFLYNGGLNIKGSLVANGTTTNKIIFTSIHDDEHGGDTDNDGANTRPLAGYWSFIKFSALSTNSILDNVVVEYGGWCNPPLKGGAIKIENTNITIANSLFENNLVAGLELENCTTTINNTVFQNHRAKYNYNMEDSMGIWVKNDAGECPDLSNVIFGEGENANLIDVLPSTCVGP